MKRALIAWGGWDGHEPEAGAARVGAILGEEGFEVVTQAGSAAFADPELGRFHLIVPILTMSTIGKELANLTAAVESGVGLAGFHGGMGDSFREAVDYQFMVGGQWVAHPGNVIDYRVDIVREDPITAGIGSCSASLTRSRARTARIFWSCETNDPVDRSWAGSEP